MKESLSKPAILLAALAVCLIGQSAPDRWEEKIREFEEKDRVDPPPQGGIVFVGSSSIRLWNLASSFPESNCINRGFGGSQMADSARYADRVVVPYRPRVVVVYAGDNDIAAGKTPEQVAADARTLAAAILVKLPDTQLVFLSIKPSIARWPLFKKMQEANQLVAEFAQQDPRLSFVDVTHAMLGPDGMPRPDLFVEDGLHLSPDGYAIWSVLVKPRIQARRGSASPCKTRLVVLTDIGGDPDDQQSLVRLLAHANDFNIEGLVATSRIRHGEDTRPDLIRQVLSSYREVRPNLILHSPDFPTAERLLDCVKAGQPVAGLKRQVMESIGDGKDTEGSEWITSVVDKPDPNPVWITIWGGSADLAQALWKIHQTRTAAEFTAFKSKIRVYAINDQDSTGPWIRQTHPDLFYITAYHAYRGLYRDGDGLLVTQDWVRTNITSRGPLGSLYPNYDGGDPWGRVLGVKEGDTPSFLYLLPNGLGDPEHPTWGSWGGRFKSPGPQFTDAKDTWNNECSERASVFRWREAYQNAFAARMNWCAQSRDAANHSPVAIVDGPSARTITPGERVELSALRSRDPDSDVLSFDWSIYREPGSYSGPLAIEGHDQPQAGFVVPEVETPGMLHVLVAVRDNGSPALTSYQRIVFLLVPRKDGGSNAHSEPEAASEQ